MSSISVSEARAVLPAILDRVAAGEEVILTRHGRQVAVVVHPDALRVRRADGALSGADQLGELVVRARSVPLADAPAMLSERADELVADVAAARSAR